MWGKGEDGNHAHERPSTMKGSSGLGFRAWAFLPEAKSPILRVPYNKAYNTLGSRLLSPYE